MKRGKNLLTQLLGCVLLLSLLPVPAQAAGATFTTQPRSGTAKVTGAYTFGWEAAVMPDKVTLQGYSETGGTWKDMAELSVLSNSGTVTYPGEGSEYLKDDGTSKYRLCISVKVDRQTFSNYSDAFTVTWTADITFDANGGTGTMAPVTCTVGSTYTLPECAFTAPTDKQFKAWSVNGKEYDPGDAVTVSVNTTVKSQWEDISDTPIDSVELRVATPVLGAAPDFDFTVTGCSVDHYGWYKYIPGEDAEWIDLEEETIFSEGYYNLYIYLKAEEGYVFAEDTAFLFNGENLPAYGSAAAGISNYCLEGGEWADLDLWFAVGNPATYTVRFDANGGSGTMSAVSGIPGQYILPECGFAPPSGMKFLCWSVNGEEMPVGNWISVAADTTLTAVWVTTCTVTFDPAGGSGAMAAVSGVYGEYILPECGFTAPSGKQFKCWSVNGEEKAAGDKITVTADTTVTAVWVIPIRTITIHGITKPAVGQKAVTAGITLDTEGMSIRTMHWLRAGTSYHMVDDTFEAGKTYPLCIYYTLADGYEVTEDVEVIHDLPGAVVTVSRTGNSPSVKLSYTIPAYTVSFAAAGGSGTMAAVPTSGEYTLPACAFTAPSGKQFKCWSVNGEEKAAGEKITVTADTTVTAVWVLSIRTITIRGITKPLGGYTAVTTGITLDTEGMSIREKHWLKAGTSNHMVNDTFEGGKTYPLLIYYTLADGYGVAEDVVVIHDLPGADITVRRTGDSPCIKLSYTLPVYTVSFAAGGGSGTMAAVPGVSGKYTLPACTFNAPSGKQFKCWSVDGSEMAAGERITVTADTVVTAVWKNKSIGVSGEVIVSGSTATAKVTVEGCTGTEATLMVAQYRSGRMVGVKLMTVTADGAVSVNGFKHQSGDAYKAFLLKAENYVPLCIAKTLEVKVN